MNHATPAAAPCPDQGRACAGCRAASAAALRNNAPLLTWGALVGLILGLAVVLVTELGRADPSAAAHAPLLLLAAAVLALGLGVVIGLAARGLLADDPAAAQDAGDTHAHFKDWPHPIDVQAHGDAQAERMQRLLLDQTDPDAAAPRLRAGPLPAPAGPQAHRRGR